MQPNERSDIYRRNIEILNKRYPQISEILNENTVDYPFTYETIVNDKSEVNITVDVPGKGRVLYYNDNDNGILSEAVESLSVQMLTKNDLLMCIGMGLGYIPIAAIGTYPDKPKIVIIEPYVEAFELAISSVDLSELFEYENLEIHLGKETAIPKLIRKYADDFYIGLCRRISHLPFRAIFGDEFISFEKEINECINNMFVGWNTIRSYGQILNENGLHNLVSLFDGITIDRLKDKFVDMPAVVVASGPSLEKDLKCIKQIRDKALILSCDSSVRPLINENIMPHMFFAVDYKNLNFEKIRMNLEELRNSIFVYWMEASSDNIRGFLGNKRVGVMSGNTFNNALIQSILGYKFNLPGAVSSNSDLAILTAIYLGCNPIILAGMDLAFSEGKDHVAGSVLKSNQKKGNMILVEGLDGRPVHSLMPMVSGRVFLENNIRINHRDFIDVSLSGAYIKGAKIKSLDEVNESILDKRICFDECINQIDWTPPAKLEKAEAPMDMITQMAFKLEKDARINLVNVCKLRNKFNKSKISQVVVKVKQTLSTLTRFKSEHKSALVMVENYRYTDQLNIDRSIANIGQNEDLTVDGLNLETLNIQKKYYRSIYLAARKAHRQSNEMNGYIHEISRLEKEKTNGAESEVNLLLLARRHAKEGMIWLAEKAYNAYLSIHANEVPIILELAELYMELRLWNQVKKLVESAETDGMDGSGLNLIKSKIEKSLTEILESAKIKIISDKIDKKQQNEARRETLEVLSVFPENQEAADLLDKIKEIEKQQEIEINDAVGFSYSQEQCALLEEKAKRAIAEGEHEKAIGIYEGFLRQFPDKENLYRTYIGDLRFETGDHKSALWNYNKGIQHSPHDEVLISRLRYVKPYFDAMSMTSENDVVAATIIVRVGGSLEAFGGGLKVMDRILPASSEVFLLCGSEKEKHAFQDIMQELSLSSQNKYEVIECDTESVISLNSALIKAKGKSIILTESGYRGDYRDISALLNKLDNDPTLCLAGPVIVDDGKKEEKKLRGGGIVFSAPMNRLSPMLFGVRHNVLETIGILDETFADISDACEDLRIRTGLKGFRNRVFSDVRIYSAGRTITPVNTHDSMENWKNMGGPAFLINKWTISHICRTGRKLFANGDVEQAVNILVEGIKTYPHCDIFYRQIAHMLIHEGRYGEALQALDAIPESDHNDALNKYLDFGDIWDRHTLYAYAMFYAGETNKAMELCDKVLAESPLDTKILNLKGMVAVLYDDTHLAVECFTRSLRMDHNFGLPWFNLGRIKQNAGDMSRAYKLTRKGFLCSPEDKSISDAYYQYGCLEDHNAEAISYFNEVICLFPENKHLHYLLIDLLIQSKCYEKTMKLIEKCIILFGKEDGIIDAALSIRDELGPEGQENTGKNKTAIVDIDSEINNIEAFLYDLKSKADKIHFIDNGNSPNSKNIAEIYGARILPGKCIDKESGSYKWEFGHYDVINWLKSMDKSVPLDPMS